MAQARTQQKMQASPSEVEQHLQNVDYPKSRDELANIARQQNAPDDVISVIQRMPDRQYGSAADVAQGVGQAE